MKYSIKNIAIETAKKGGRILRERFYKIHKVNRKDSQQSIVTDADFASEKAMIQVIKECFPTHSILSEESGKTTTTENKYLWIIDPLDGTANYASGNPYFSVSVAIQHNGETIVGVTHNPVTGELFIAERGKGTTYNGRKTRVSKTTDPENAIICVDWNHYKGGGREEARDILYEVGKKVRRVLSYGSGVLAASHVAVGIFDAYFNIQSHPWDHAAASLIVQESGGEATTSDGRKQVGLTNSVLVSNGKIHSYLLKLLR
ncbi:MAG: inositol monophosphatase [Candidatus Liptonbacteria bacterium]